MMKTTQHPLTPPSLEELAKTLQPALDANYEQASATVAHCPDLSQPPFHLASAGLSGNECVADIGGQPHLFPRPLLDKKYSLLECAQCMNLSQEGGMLIGAGAGPFHDIGKNTELAPNLSWQGDASNVKNLTRFTEVESITDGKTKVVCQASPSTNCALMMNLFGSSGEPGPVLKVTARTRKGEQKSFTECIRGALHDAYGGDRQISVAGAFLIKKGKAFFHVMPDFPPESKLPFRDRDDVSHWLTYHHFSAPMVCLTVFHSADPEKLGLRMEHTHCFSESKDQGGHYHYDLAAGEDGAEEIEYEAYFNTAKVLYRIDKPESL
ncbi:hypothetical protein LTR36_008683 [Oleoguttula mirabilis]|uniref:DUF1907 domain-containing protein n=1 Tax=Oleoguttula mirabilis TaxID=1507867 RepID=A0AAV9JUF6_9PEZI|nr:hypothetical protein LTR36_008683 [Oleoguttula mirabilis]